MYLREVIGAVESYEPVYGLTLQALELYRDDPRVCGKALYNELERVRESPIVLNRKLRQAVLAAVQRRGLSMSEIAHRCGRVKRDCKGNASGETSWLARRVGVLPESATKRLTPWIDSDVLALIARNGLGISPREVELDETGLGVRRGSSRRARAGGGDGAQLTGAGGTIPLARAADAHALVPDRPGSILVVESDMGLARALVEQLLDDGYRVEPARTAEHARMLARGCAPRLAVLGELGSTRGALELLYENRRGAAGSAPWVRGCR